MKVVVITGANGFIGKNLFKKIYNNNDLFVLVDLFVNNEHENNVTYINADLTSKKQCKKLYNKSIESVLKIYPNYDIHNIKIDLYHLAAVVGVESYSSQEKAIESYRINRKINKNILKYFNNYNTRIFFASTSEVYGDCANAKENEKFYQIFQEPRGLYALEKIEFENKLRYKFKGQSIILRFFNVTGVDQSKHKGVIPKIIDCAKNSKEFTVYGSGNQRRSYILVSDVVDIIQRLSNRNDLNKTEIFNIGNPYNYFSILDICKFIKEIKPDFNFKYEESDTPDIKDRRPNCEKLFSILYLDNMKDFKSFIREIL